MQTGTFVLAPSADAARARAFLRARRHSRHVWAARRAVEFGVVGAVVIFAAVALVRNFARGLPGVSFEGIGIEGGRITMDRPRLTGARPGGGGYAITAVKAMQDAAHPGDVDLALIGGDITTPDRETSRLSANSGRYQGEGETLDLEGDVRLTNSRYEIFLKSVHIEFKKGDYVSKEPVTVRILPDVKIDAESFEARDGGAQVRFAGHVRSLIRGGAVTSVAP